MRHDLGTRAVVAGLQPEEPAEDRAHLREVGPARCVRGRIETGRPAACERRVLEDGDLATALRRAGGRGRSRR
jgi:hypothetical protein